MALKQSTFGRMRAIRAITKGLFRDLCGAIFRLIIAMVLGFGRWIVTDMIRDLMIASGIILSSYGAFLVYKPAGFITPGVIFLAIGGYGLIRRK